MKTATFTKCLQSTPSTKVSCRAWLLGLAWKLSFYSWGGSFVQKISISTYVALVEGCQRGWSIPKKIGKICRLQLQYWQYCGLTLLINIIAVPNSAKLHGFKWYQCEPDWLEVDSIDRAYKTLKQCVLCLSTLLALLLTVIPYLGW